MRATRRVNRNKTYNTFTSNAILNEISQELKYLKGKLKELEVLETRNCILLERNQEKMNLILQEIYRNRIVSEEQTEEILEMLEDNQTDNFKKSEGVNFSNIREITRKNPISKKSQDEWNMAYKVYKETGRDISEILDELSLKE